MADIVYRIAKWEQVFERAESRKLKQLTWVAMPIGFNSSGYQAMLDEFGEEAATIYGAWCALVLFSASCHFRGVLANGRGIPLTISHIARTTGIPNRIFETLIAWASRDGVRWLEVVSPDEVAELVGENIDKPNEFSMSGESPDNPPARRGNSHATRPPPNQTITSPPPPQTPPSDMAVAVVANDDMIFELKAFGVGKARQAATCAAEREITLDQVRSCVAYAKRQNLGPGYVVEVCKGSEPFPEVANIKPRRNRERDADRIEQKLIREGRAVQRTESEIADSITIALAEVGLADLQQFRAFAVEALK